ncbi:receptor-like protein CLAVATA2 [Camellia sinensis]|uniref:receptor-like protein CLAVATA2 n=1 Tax=Camellia sinensis TaxID=4442 RepID=UPI001035EF07|nr:receptor-like protein CLAVATA2 [Camellia sinensis]XP_028077301.1 receptor-like protein CLAVATA2 [Camellia sinensis]
MFSYNRFLFSITHNHFSVQTYFSLSLTHTHTQTLYYTGPSQPLLTLDQPTAALPFPIALTADSPHHAAVNPSFPHRRCCADRRTPLCLNDNQLTGKIPRELTGISSLKVVDVSNNLCGTIPTTGPFEHIPLNKTLTKSHMLIVLC